MVGLYTQYSSYTDTVPHRPYSLTWQSSTRVINGWEHILVMKSTQVNKIVSARQTLTLFSFISFIFSCSCLSISNSGQSEHDTGIVWTHTHTHTQLNSPSLLVIPCLLYVLRSLILCFSCRSPAQHGTGDTHRPQLKHYTLTLHGWNKLLIIVSI